MQSLGIDLGGTFTKIALVSLSDGRIIRSGKLPSVGGKRPREAIAALRCAAEELTVAAGYSYPPPAGFGIGLPSLFDSATGRVGTGGALDWDGVDLGGIARDAFGGDVTIDGDTQAGALADLYFGRARGASDVLYVSWGTGIGAAIVVSRRLYRTRGGTMNELGHMPADPLSDRLCFCGCRGCLEIEAGGKAMAERAREAVAAGAPTALASCEEITPERIAAAASDGDPLARQILDRCAVLMARALAGALALLNPDMVVFGGGVSRCFPLIQEAFDRELRLRTPSFALASTRIVQSEFGDKAGVIGAALLPFERKGWKL